MHFQVKRTVSEEWAWRLYWKECLEGTAPHTRQ